MAANPFDVLLRAIPYAGDAGNHRCAEVAIVFCATSATSRGRASIRNPDRVPMFDPCYRIPDMVETRHTGAPAVMARVDSLLVQLARAKRFAAAIRHDAARDKSEAMAADLQRELESIRPR
jgi:hypothetical protein